MQDAKTLIDAMDGKYRFLHKSTRMKNSDQKLEELLTEIEDYDLTPVAKLLDCQPPFEFTSCLGTNLDFSGVDFILKGENKEFGIQDKRRTSSKGIDLGIEFARFYKVSTQNTKTVIVTDGGRDIYRTPLLPIEATNENGVWKAKREWATTETQAEVFLLHTKGGSELIWIKAAAAKAWPKKLLSQWWEMANVDNEPYQLVKRMMSGFLDRLTLNNDFNTMFDVKCLREPKDTKKVILDGLEVPACPIGKAICYLPLHYLVEGVDYAVCERG